MKETNQRVASLEHDPRHPRLAIEADGPADKQTRERTEGAAKAVQAMYGDSFSAKRIQDGPKSSTTIGEKVKPPVLPCRDDVLVKNGAAAPNSCLSLLEMRTATAASGLLPTGETSTATMTTFDHSTLWFFLPEETNSRTSTLYTPDTTTVSTCVLPPPAGGSLKQSRGKVGCSI